MVPERRGKRCLVVLAAAAVFTGVASCAPPEPVGEDLPAQTAVGASDGGEVLDGGWIADMERGLESPAEPGGGAFDGGVVELPRGSESAEPDGENSDSDLDVEGMSVMEGEEPDGEIGGDGVDVELGSSEGVPDPEGSSLFRQPGELVGYPGLPGVVVGEGAGPLRREYSRWDALMGQVFDVCDYSGAATAVTGTVVGPGDEVSALAQHEISELQKRECGDGGEPGYAHVTWDGPGPVRASPREATEAVQDRPCLYGCGHNLGYGGMGLGYEAPHGMFAVDSPIDEMVVLWDSVAVSGDEVMGLVQNRSVTLFARAVKVALGDHHWLFPLTVQPGEVAPFVLNVEPVPELAELSEIEVSAIMSSQPDLSRALYRYFPVTVVVSFDRYSIPVTLADPVNALNLAALNLPLDEEDWIRYWFTGVSLVEPNSHPGTGAAREQVFEDMRAYLGFLDGHGKVFAVHRLTPLDITSDPTSAVTQLPIIDDDGRRSFDFELEFFWLADSKYDELEVKHVLLVGAAGPSTEQLVDAS